jgi:hypothetical protein
MAWSGNRDQATVSLGERYLMNSFFMKWAEKTRRSRRGAFARLALPGGASEAIAMRYRHEPRIEDRAAFTEIERVMRFGAESCQARGIRLLVVAVPTFARAARQYLTIEDDELREEFLPADGGDRSEFATSLGRLCGELGCGFIDATPRLREELARDPRSAFIPGDEHFDRRGHAAVADAIVQWIETEGITSDGTR